MKTLVWPGVAAIALMAVVACSSSKSTQQSGTGGEGGTGISGSGGAVDAGSASGGSGTGGLGEGGPGSGGAASGGSGGRAGGGGSAVGGRASGGITGQGGGTGGHEIGPVICGTMQCPLGDQCCRGCDGTPITCAVACTSPVCGAGGAGGQGGAPVICGTRACAADEYCCGPPACGFCDKINTGPNCPTTCPGPDGGTPDASDDAAAGSIPCGTGTCGPTEACVHPARGGSCLMPDAGQCPAGTSTIQGCCLPPDMPTCVPIDGPCSGPSVTCSCFSKDPCSQGCANGGARIQGRDVVCVAA